MRYVTSEIVTEVIGIGERATRRRVEIIDHDEETCRVASGHVYRRDTGAEYVRGSIYRAIHDPALDHDGKKHKEAEQERERAEAEVKA